MTGRISMSARRELVSAIAERYRLAGRVERGRILDELTAVTGWHRKHAVRTLNRGRPGPLPLRVRRCTYGATIREALIALWEASDRVCGKRLKVMIPALLPAMEMHGQLGLTPEDRICVLSASPATIDRLLSDIRITARGSTRRRAGFSSAVRRSVPVRTFGDWNDPPPGFCEVDFVAHCGMSTAGAFVQTLVMVDVATGWTECFPLIIREGALVIEAIGQAGGLFPWPIQGVDFDSDSAFMNDVVVPWCRGRNLEVTRSRAYQKNDQAFVEQKNGAIVRRLVGYGRFEGLAAAQVLARLYAAARLYVNFFQPSFKLKEKRREGAKVVKLYHAPATPFARAQARPDLDPASKRRLSEVHRSLDPVVLLAEIRAAQRELGARVDRRPGAVGPGPTLNLPHEDVATFLKGLGNEWRLGERRATHRRQYVRRKPIPRRPSMMDPHISVIEEWLAAEPHLRAVEILARLDGREAGSFGEKQLRTVQRLVKAWRGRTARLLIDGAETTLMLKPSAAVKEAAAVPLG
jgi:hypothetical protein